MSEVTPNAEEVVEEKEVEKEQEESDATFGDAAAGPEPDADQS